MRKPLIILMAVLSALFAGCNKQDSTTFGGTETGFLSAGRFTSDNGVTMKVDGNEGNFDILSSRRVMLSYETHPVVSPYDVTIDLRGLWDAVIVEPVPFDDIPEDAADAPVQVTDAWFSGGYLNILAGVPYTDPALHTFSLAYAVNANNAILRLRHGSTEESTTGWQEVFISIPMADIVLAFDQFGASLGLKPATQIPVLFQWTWYEKIDGPAVLLEKEGSFTPAS